MRRAIPLALAAAFTIVALTPARGSADTRSIASSQASDYAVRYLRNPETPAPTDKVFWAIGHVAPRGVQYVTANSDSGRALLVFTSPFRAWTYGIGAADIAKPFVMLAWTAEMAADRLRRVHDDQGIHFLALDHATGCDHIQLLPLEPAIPSKDLLELWRSWREVAVDVGDRNYPDALSLAERGDFESSWRRVRELITCVIPEEPRLHVLAGACGIAAGEERIVKTASYALEMLDPSIAAKLSRAASRASGKSVEERREIALEVVRMAADVKTPVLKR